MLVFFCSNHLFYCFAMPLMHIIKNEYISTRHAFLKYFNYDYCNRKIFDKFHNNKHIQQLFSASWKLSILLRTNLWNAAYSLLAQRSLKEWKVIQAVRRAVTWEIWRVYAFYLTKFSIPLATGDEVKSEGQID